MARAGEAVAAAMSPSQEQPEQQPSGRQSAARERTTDEPVVTTTSAERYVMSGGRASRLAIKEGDLFLYADELGQVPGTENSVLGLYYRDTRYLSRYEFSVAGRQPVLLSSSAERGYAATVELTNLESRTPDGHTLPQASVHVRRTRFLSDRLYELLQVRNYHQREVELVLDLHLDADFADLFEVRGSRRRRRGSRLAPRMSDGTLTLSYLGLDEVTRQTIVRFHDRPESIKQGRARFRLHLAPGAQAAIRYDVQVVGPGAPGEAGGEFNERVGAIRREHERWESDATEIFTDNDQLNRALRRGQDDLRLLSTVIDGERVPLAGLPWFAAPFGREMVFVGLETLLLDLRWARAAVSFLARRQGTVDNAFRDEQPGKIMHELRRGELAALRAVPHTPYYGSVDATALWLLLVAELAVWTGDLDGFELQAAAVEAALAWIDGPGDPDGDGFVEYERRSRVGLRNQGWRDSVDAVLHDDGSPAGGPIALAETQGYVYYAKRRLAAVYGQLGDVERAEQLSQSAARLKAAFHERFWMEDEGFYAMALDGRKRQVRQVSSTIGHALWSRIVPEERIPDVVRRLMAPDMFTGWGIRTLSKDARFYNPVSFYNGSVWPFDTALIANGLKKHGYVHEADRLAWGLVEAATAHEYARLPEMFCGLSRRASDRPVSFPMACSPDANSAAALFLVLQSMLGIYAQAEENIVYVHNPVLPRWLGEVTLSNLRVGRTTMRLRFRREGGQTSFSVLDKQGPGRIVVVE
jgi:glycogen debranching enzyme